MCELVSNANDPNSNAILHRTLPRKESLGAIPMTMSSKDVESISMEDSVVIFTTARSAAKDDDDDDDDDGLTPSPMGDVLNSKLRCLLGVFSFLGVLAICDITFYRIVRGRESVKNPEESRTSRPFTSTRQWILDHAPLSTERSLLVPTSPQSKALAWVLKAAPDEDHDRVLTRFAMATLLYTTGQEVPQDECTVLSDCDAHGLYTRLDLSHRGMSGEMPPEVALMSQLTYLDLSYNDLKGTIPSEIGLLTKLVELKLNHNGFQGTIPRQLGLLTHMTKLEFVALRGISGTIPDELANLVELQSFVLINTNVTGPLPRWIGKWINCSVVQLHKNPQLHGSLPTELAQLKKLTDFTVAENNLLTGEIPSDLWTLPKLRSLTVDASSMNGTIATQIGHELQILRLNMELLSGTIPTVLGELSNLETLSLSSPLLFGQLPSQLSMCRNLVSLTITHTQLSQTLPTQLGNLESLEVLMLQGNHWTGTIPSAWATMSNLTFLSVEDNELIGPIPFIHGLEVLHLGLNNGLSGTIKSCFGGDVIVDCQDVVCDCCRCT
jgi:Leucine-rich repeat (LRR) protein